ncbi:hypothetical protein [Rhizobium sp. NRK18]|uniref:hypothetical protein n=1 Tax=Rhizobium sp. NRK18 TaxID=2964667 RepID=UPI0021C2EC5B|nr:hypothetical protein [Rhizobium sp. NRK18]MCQ2003618.1 hypothetical protein [Rhizobium sp. NRK18]
MKSIVSTLVVVTCAGLMSACTSTDALTPPLPVGETSSAPVGMPLAQEEAQQIESDPVDTSQFPPPPQSAGSQIAATDQMQQQPMTAPGPVQPAATGTMLTPQIAAAASVPAIRFLPIIGAPVSAVTPLSQALGNEARSRGLTIKPAADASGGDILKGYFSSAAGDNGVTVIYVWDVLDNAGSRLHRIQGQEAVPGPVQGDAWASVPASVMQKIAADTISAYLSWKQTAS